MTTLEQKIGSLQCPEHHKRIHFFNLSKDCVGSRIKCRQCVNELSVEDFSIEQLDVFFLNIYKQTHSQLNTQLQSKINDFNAIIHSVQEQLNQISQYFEQQCNQLSQQDIFTTFKTKLSSKAPWKLEDFQLLADTLSKNIEITANHQIKYKPQTINLESLNQLDNIIKSLKSVYSQLPKINFHKASLVQIQPIKKVSKYREYQHFNEQKHRIVDLAVHHSTNTLISGSDGPENNLIQWKYKNEKWIEQQNYKHFNDGVFALKFNKTSEYLALGGVNELIICSVSGDNINVVQKIFNNNPNCQHINSIDWCNNNDYIITGWSCGLINVYQKQNQEWKETQILKKHNGYINSISVNYNSTIFASGSKDKQIILWQLDKQEWKHSQILQDHRDNVWCVNFSKTTNQLISCSDDGTIKIWIPHKDDGPYKCICSLHDHNDSVYMVNFSPDSTMFMSCGQDLTLRLWNQDESMQWICYQILPQERNLTPIGVYMTSNGEFLILSLIGNNINKLKVFKLE